MNYKFLKKKQQNSDFLYENWSKPKTKTKLAVGFISVLSIAAGLQASSMVARQAIAEANTTFQVNVVETLSVSVTTDSSESTDVPNTFLRSPVTVDVTSNNANGFTASMYATNDSASQTIGSHTVVNTDLTNGTTDYISTLSASTQKSSFAANNWGYSLQNNTTDSSEATTGDNRAGKATSTYSPVVSDPSSPTTVMERSSAATGTQTIWFGAKADITKAAGTYSNTVVLSVVSGDVTQPTDNPNDNPITPTNPATPSIDTPNNDTATYTGANTTGVGSSGSNGTTVYTTTSTSGNTETTNTEITAGDVTTSYAPVEGVTENTLSNIHSGSPLAAGLAATAGVAATSSAIFFILAKRKKDDDEEEEENQQQS